GGDLMTVTMSGLPLVGYAHNGRRRLVEVDMMRSSVSLSDHQGDGDSAYEGLDRFARRIDHYWAGYGAGSDIDRFRYTYDVSGSRTSRDIDSALYSADDRDQAYQYDALRRLTDFRRGKLVGGQIADADSERDEQWILSTLGNWDQYRWDANGGTGNWVTQSRAFNSVNEVDVDDDHGNAPGNSISGANGADWVDPAFDANGNMTSGPAGFAGFETVGAQFTYDAWNRVVIVSDGSGSWVRRYEYDGLGHRIVKETFAGGSLVDTFDLYQNYFGQTVEIRKNGSVHPYKQYVWHPHNLTGIAACFFDPDTDGQSIAELNFTDDANGNVTGILWAVGGVGIPVERVDYDAYGSPQFLDANFNVSSSPFISGVDHNILYGGYEFDEGVGIYNLHFRSYHPRLGRWLQRDPVNYADGQNLYEYTQGAPLDYVDHLGLSKCKKKVLKTESVGYSKSWPFPPVRVRGGPYAKIETGGGITQSVSGSRKQKCCPDCRIVWDEELTHSVTVSIWIRGTAGIDEKIGNVSVFGGLQLELSGSGTGTKKISTDGCKDEPAKAEICLEADVTGTARGGIDIEIDVFWWYTARIAAVIEASINVDSLGFCCDCPAMTNCKPTQDPSITISWKFTFCVFGICFSVGGEKKLP
ncbi:MAG: RHS repeat-associated core domain-containing protein, partial [Planctomycetota bacterium]